MATELFIPQLGQTVEEVTLVRWLVEDGAQVTFGQPLLDVETDKAVFPVEANADGTLHIGPFAEGKVVPVLTVVAVIGKKEEQFAAPSAAPAAQPIQETSQAAALPALAPDKAAAPSGGGRVIASPRARRLATARGVNLALLTPSGDGGQRVAERDVLAYLSQAHRATPLAQRIAAEQGVDLVALSGSGPGGRIVKEDVARAVRAAVQPAAAETQLPPAEVVERLPLKGVRALIAERMGASVHTTARVTLVAEADATEFVAARQRLKERLAASWGFSPGYNDLLVMIAAAALRRFPYMNARLASDAIERLGRVNIGLAVDTERGLLVPVIRDADQKSLQQIASESRRLIEQARNGRSLPDDLSGGTFTITNLGMYDIDAFTPVINLPEAAILGVGRLAEKVVPYRGEIAIRQMLTLSLVFDHRVVDGAPAARFLQHIKQVIEEPYLLLA
jgi:pyruvate dehydrogenase E2 component (dihydrolipoamide acetyltransferase)